VSDDGEPPVTCGLEVHQQLGTGKLFCSCPTHLDEPTTVEIERRLRPTESELGEVDQAALAEARKGRTFAYEASEATSCLVEADEEPPHAINEDALDVALTLALITGADPADEVHTMRKIVIDGSNTTGFQRTALVALGGSIETEEGDVDLEAMALEEDAARIVERGKREARYRLDRLGIPLIEVATAPQLHSPEQAREAAERIGQLIRATGQAKRGLGTIRQDLNISVPEGARVEIKGVQDLDLLPEYVRVERDRQRFLADLADRLAKAADPDDLPDGPEPVTERFAGTDAGVIRDTLDDGGAVLALALPGFDGHLGEGDEHRLGRELAGYARSQGAEGLFHTDELPAYGVTADEVEAVHEALGTTPGEDAFCLVAADADVAERSLEAALERAGKAFEGVPEETRQALEDGTTRYLRPLPGSARMYPETDVPPARVDAEHLDELASDVPELPSERADRYVEELGLNREVAEPLAAGREAVLFEELVEGGATPGVAASAILQVRPQVEDEGADVPDDLLREAVLAQAEGAFTKDALEDVLLHAAEEDVGVDAAVEALGLGGLSEDEARQVVEELVEDNAGLVEERGMGAMGALMGQAMEQLRGKVEGETVNRLVREAIQERAG